MQTIKGLSALLLVAVAVFAMGAMNDIKSRARHAAKLFKPAAASPVATVRLTGTSTETNAVHQVRQNIKNANL